jgi:predicted transposase YbfD/YdcC
MNCTTTTSDLPTETQGVVFDLGGLYAEFERLTDQRKARGKRYRLALVLLLIVLAKLCGEDRPYGMAQWISARTHSLIAILGLACHRLPSLNTYRRVLQQAVDVGQLQKAVKRFLCRDPGPGHHVLVSIDGKTLRGSFDPGQGQAVHVLAAYLPKEGIVLMQVAVASQENELSAAPRLLQCLDLRGQIVMGDAIFTQRQLSIQIVEAGGDYIWIAKDNQRGLREAIAQLFVPPTRSPGWGIPPDDFQIAKEQNKGHGRLEERILTSSELLNDYLDWPYLAQVFKLERCRTQLKDGTNCTEVVYGLTSLSRHKADATRLLALVRDYWGIENGLFYRRDATLHEDGIRMTNSKLAQAMAIFNNLVIGLIIQQGWRYLPQARRHYDANPKAALALLLHPPS